eukprot:1058075-Rhodomonas_salina.3
MNRRRFLQWPSLEGWNAEGSPELGCISLEGGHAFCDGFEEGQVEQRDRERQGLVDEVAGVIQHKILDLCASQPISSMAHAHESKNTALQTAPTCKHTLSNKGDHTPMMVSLTKEERRGTSGPLLYLLKFLDLKSRNSSL